MARRPAAKKPSPSGRGLGAGETQCAANRSPAVIQSPHRHSVRAPLPSFRRRPESRTPVCPELRKGRGVDSRFRGNDGGGGNYGNGERWVAASKSPLPAGEGWVREKRNAPPTGSPPSIAPIVIPAQAGIQNPSLSRTAERPGRGFPLLRECRYGAGITRMGRGGPPPKSPLPAGEGWVREKRGEPPTPSTPHHHSSHPPSFRRRPESRTPVCPELRKGRGVDSRFRGNDGTGRE